MVATCVVVLEPTNLTKSLSIWSLVDLDPLQGGVRSVEWHGEDSCHLHQNAAQCCMSSVYGALGLISSSAYMVHGGSQLQS